MNMGRVQGGGFLDQLSNKQIPEMACVLWSSLSFLKNLKVFGTPWWATHDIFVWGLEKTMRKLWNTSLWRGLALCPLEKPRTWSRSHVIEPVHDLRLVLAMTNFEFYCCEISNLFLERRPWDQNRATNNFAFVFALNIHETWREQTKGAVIIWCLPNCWKENALRLFDERCSCFRCVFKASGS